LGRNCGQRSPGRRGERGAIDQLGLVRIDDRLIHGQVIAVWCRHQHFTRILIADDDVASDQFMSTVLKLAAPTGLDVDVLSLEDCVASLTTDTPDRATTMVLVKSPEAARRLHDGGVRFDSLNVGGIGGGAGRTNVFRNIALSPDDFSALQYLAGEGVRVTLQTLPGEKAKDFSELSEKRS
jgi:PTS system mannose-specific IIB component